VRLLYVANARIPSRKAHSYQIVQMCDAFAETGFEVELLVPDRRKPPEAPDESIGEYYDVPATFTVTRAPCLDLLSYAPRLPAALARLVFYLQALTFTASALWLTARRDPDAVYSRAALYALLGALPFGRRTVYEAHRGPPRWPFDRLAGAGFDRLRGVVAISEGLREVWRERTATPIVVEPDAVDLARFPERSRADARAEVGFDSDATLVTYAGSIQPWKGVQTLVRAADRLPADHEVCIVGGTDEQIAWLRDAVGAVPDSVTLVGRVPPDRVPAYLRASDVLVVPNTADREISRRYTSPLKVFEYMAAERPIVASDLPSLREVLDDETAYFFAPGDPDSMADAIVRVTDDPDRAAAVAAWARERVERYTWERRAERIGETFFDGDGADPDATEGPERCTS